MRSFRAFFSRIGSALKSNVFQNVPNNYKKIMIASGLIGATTISSIYLYRNYGHYLPKPSHQFLIYPFSSKRRENNNFIVTVTEKCAPSVVAIEVKNSKRMSAETGEAMLTSTGSGFVVDSNGWIMTNAHVIMNKPNAIVNVITTTGKTYEATVYDIDLKLDLALLKISCNNLPALRLGRSKDVLTGEWVVALGSPLSLKHTITAGVVSSVNRQAKDLGFTYNDMKYIQTDAAITFGHSGGPLVNLDGEVIGVNNLRITAGIAFAIPIDYVKEFLLRSKLHAAENARIQQAMNQPKFGITALVLTDEIVTAMFSDKSIILPEKPEGILIYNVIQNSPADKAGLQIGDVIVEINYTAILNTTDFYNALLLNEAQPIIFTVYRKGVKTKVYLQVKDKK